jgi:CHASE3 domain sensor protein
MIRKAALRIAAVALLAFTAVNAYLAISHLRRVEKTSAMVSEGPVVLAQIAAVAQALTDMETGQRGYLLTGDESYLQPYMDAKARIGTEFASLRDAFSERPEEERSSEAQLETLAASKQEEMERTITFRQKGYRHRAFVLVNTNEGKEYMDRARTLLASLSSMESSRFAGFEKAKNDSLNRAFSESIIANGCLLVLTACVLGFIFYYGDWLEKKVAHSNRLFVTRDSELSRLTSALAHQARSSIMVIEDNTRQLLGKFGGFLPKQGYEYAEQIKDAADELEQLRQGLTGSTGRTNGNAGRIAA